MEEVKREVARAYQLELLEHAKKMNVIAVLKTGAGKVINQQADYLRYNSDLNVTEAYGALGVDSWEKSKWENIFDESDVLVMTPQVLVNIIHSAMITFHSISLIVFDECHHTRKGHPYNQLMEVYRHFNGEKPKIFGMTASPICSNEDALNSIRTLEKNLECKAFSVDISHSGQQQNYLAKPKEEIIFYELGPFFRLPALYKKFIQHGGTSIPLVNKKLKDVLTDCDELGTWWADRHMEILYGELRNFSSRKNFEKIWSEREDGEIDSGDEIIIKDELEQKELTEFISRLIKDVEKNLVCKVESNFGKRKRKEVDLDLFPIPTITEADISPKLKCLFDLLEGYEYDSTFSGMIFVETRRSSVILKTAFLYHPKLSKFLRPQKLVGHGNQDSINFSMLSTEQEIVVKKFRDNVYNILIATRIGEEGIDIQSCMLVVRFDQFRSVINYIQSRGRARHQESKYICMLPKGDVEKLRIYKEILAKEVAMNKALLESAAEDSRDADDEEDGNNTPYLLKPEEIFTIPSTQAIVTIFSAISVLHRYCAMLPIEEFCSSVPKFRFILVGDVRNDSQQCKCVIRLPFSVPPDCRVFEGPPCDSKRKAKQYACFLAIKNLYEAGELDGHFRPIQVEIAEAVKVIPQKTKQASSKVRKFNAGLAECLKGSWEDKEEFYLSIIKIKLTENAKLPTYKYTQSPVKLENKVLNVGVLTSNRIQKEGENEYFFELPIREEGGHLGVALINDEKKILVSKKKLSNIKTFHTKCLNFFLKALMKVEADWAYLIAPIKFVNDSPVLDELTLDLVMDNFDQNLFSTVFEDYQKKIGVFVKEMKEKTNAGDEIGYNTTVAVMQPPSPPDFEHPYEKSFLQIMEDPNFDLEFHKENTILVDHYYYGRKYMIVDVLDIKPGDPFPMELLNPEETLAKNYFKKFATLERFYKGRLRCFEKIKQNQKILRVIQVPQFCQPDRLKTHYCETNTTIEYLDFPFVKYCKSPAALYIIPQFSRLFFVKKPVLLNDIIYLPLILRTMEHSLNCRDIHERLNLHFIPRLLLQQALTTPAAQLPFDYERLEVIGDSFMKLLISLHLFASNPTHLEGRLAIARSSLEGNRLFTKKAVKIGLYKAMLTTPLTRLLWAPAVRQWTHVEYELITTNSQPPDNGANKDTESNDVEESIQKDISEAADGVANVPSIGKPILSDVSHQRASQVTVIGDKTIADGVEALVGAGYISKGIRFGVKAANNLLDSNYEENWANYAEIFKKQGYFSENETKSKKYLESIKKVEQLLGYTFKHKHLVLEALTHPSAVEDEEFTTCYQRLEFLGDAVLHFLTTRFIYIKYPLLSPGTLSSYRSTLVCNKFLSCVCGVLGIQKYIRHYSPSFTKPMVDFGKLLEERYEIYKHLMGKPEDGLNYDSSKDVFPNRGTVPFWDDFDDTPKAIADVFEALLGAVFVDSLDVEEEKEFSLDTIMTILNNTMLIPWLPLVGPPCGIVNHPVKQFMDSCHQLLHCRAIDINAKRNYDGTYCCEVSLHETVICKADAESKKSSRRAAAIMGLDYLKKHALELRNSCTCTGGAKKDVDIIVID
ncbi:hypothetical protein HK099_003811 [Clydaea vesicula]|uniref:Dicer-2 n=1 Tax=Clydaea vesicula TaxID=447962 RepID=A0AAD5U166_9FUNG|nr:hypothetical protein HK099_003811 [Clydaea vesicula]